MHRRYRINSSFFSGNYTIKHKFFWRAVAFSLLFIIGAGYAFSADVDERLDALNTYLIQEKNNLTQLTENISPINDGPISQADLTQRKQENATMLALIDAKISSLNDFLSNQRKQQLQLNRRLKKLQQLPLDKLQNNSLSDERMMRINTLKTENSEVIQLIEDNLSLANAYQARLLAEHNRLDLLQANMAEQQKLNELREKIYTLKRLRNDLYQKNIVLQQEEKPDESFAEHLNVEAQVLLNNQAIILLQHQMTELGLQKNRIAADYQLLKNQDLKTIESVTDLYKLGVKQLAGIELSLKKMLELLDHEPSLVSSRTLKQKIATLKKNASLNLKSVIIQQKDLREALVSKQEQLNKQLASRQSLAEYHLSSWPTITNQLLQIPTQFYNYAKLLVLKVQGNYAQKEPWAAVFLWFSLGLIIIVAVALSRVLNYVVQDKERSNMSGRLLIQWF